MSFFSVIYWTEFVDMDNLAMSIFFFSAKKCDISYIYIYSEDSNYIHCDPKSFKS